MRIAYGWFGHDVFPWHGVARRSVLGDRRLAARWDTATEKEGGWADDSRAPTIAMTASVRIGSSGSPGKLAAIRG